jgi:hypothetical protein
MKMIKQVLIQICLWLTYYGSAQTIDKTVIANGGEGMSNAEIHINSTIGEPLVGAIINDYAVDQGFWAGSLMVEPLMPEEELGGMFVFPNPVEDILTLVANNNRIFGLTLFSVDGSMVYRKKVDESLVQHQIDASMLAKGVYVLQVLIEESSEEKLFKIIKK